MGIINFFRRLYLKFRLFVSRKKVFYINGSDKLPPPLDADVEDAMIEHISEQYARDALIEHNLRLVVYIAKRFENTGAGIEELVSIGTVGLIKAISTFNKEKNIKLATYASRCIENEILMYLRKISKQKQEVSLDEPLSSDGEGNELVLFDLLPSVEDCPQTSMEKMTEKGYKVARRTIAKYRDQLGIPKARLRKEL